jgi:FtsP/CotA-like multicopper oxidase with cupredoxin domain
VIVDITNNMAARTTAIHWHGVFQQGSQFMDGVPMLTQCSIHESDTFRYDFIANNEGTHFWHSHDGSYTLWKATKLVRLIIPV